MRFLNHHYPEKSNVIRSHLSVKAVTSIFPFIDLYSNLRWLDTQIHLSTPNPIYQLSQWYATKSGLQDDLIYGMIHW